MNALLFLAHTTSPRTLLALEKLRSGLPEDFRLFPVLDLTNQFCDPERLPADTLCVTFPEIVKESSYPGKIRQSRQQQSFYPGCQDLILLWFARHHPAFNFYWVVEYDVDYTGDWRNFFSDFVENDSDLLATTIFRYDFCPTWCHWPGLKVSFRIRRANYLRAFCCIARYSNAALTCLDRAYKKGWSGHFECLIPTTLHANGLSIEDFGGNGEFVKSGNLNKYYFNNPIDPYHQPGSFTVSANSFDPASAPPLLHHPVKY